jgi:hypothetical protein
MKKIDLSYLAIPKDHEIVELLKAYGEQIHSGTYNMVSYIVTDTRSEGELKSASLYLIVPEINKQHQLLTIEIVDVENIKIRLWPLTTNTPEPYDVKYSQQDYSEFDEKIGDILNCTIVKQIISFYVEGIKFKREVRQS